MSASCRACTTLALKGLKSDLLTSISDVKEYCDSTKLTKNVKKQLKINERIDNDKSQLYNPER